VTTTTQPAGQHPKARYYGPSAIEDDARRFVNLTVTLARTDFKVRYYGSVLGYLWSLVRPLLFFGVLYLVFTKVFRFGRGVPHYPVELLTAIVLWTFFVETTSNSVQSLVTREGLLRKMRFPRLVIPLSVALTALFNLGMNMIAVLVFAIANGVYPRWSWFEMPLLVLLLAMLGVGTGMLLSALYVRFRDVQPIWEVIAQALFYLSPVIYVAAQYRHVIRIAMLNPIATILTQMHYAWVGGTPTHPVHSAAVEIGGAVRLLIPLALIVIMLVAGWLVFNREAPRIAENL
jgi:ABC-2 type transport system permease protein